WTMGLLQRRPSLQAVSPIHIGKEANYPEEQEIGLRDPTSALNMHEPIWPLVVQVLKRVSIVQAISAHRTESSGNDEYSVYEIQIHEEGPQRNQHESPTDGAVEYGLRGPRFRQPWRR